MSQYHLWSRMNAYEGGYGKAGKEQIHSITGDRLSQQFFDDGDLLHKSANDFAGGVITAQGLQSRLKRDLAVDAANPQERLPPDLEAMRQQDIVPMFGYSKGPDLSSGEDYNPHTQVKMVQDSFFNSVAQENLFTDAKLWGKDKYITEKTGKEPRGVGQETLDSYSFDGSAAGYFTNHLTDDNYKFNSIESMTAF